MPIVTSQRDRFRQRNAELEEELRKQFHIISELRSEVKALQADNLKLYEKVRYMQSYREDTLNPLPVARQDDLSKYHARYEEAMNPFEAFRGRVRLLLVIIPEFFWHLRTGSSKGVQDSQPNWKGCFQPYKNHTWK